MRKIKVANYIQYFSLAIAFRFFFTIQIDKWSLLSALLYSVPKEPILLSSRKRTYVNYDKMLDYITWLIPHLLNIFAHICLLFAGFIAFVTEGTSGPSSLSHVVLPWAACGIVSPLLRDFP